MLGTSSSLERLPVVELRPFVNRQWLPSKSRPDFYDRSLTSLSGFSSSSSQASIASTRSYSYSPRKTHGTTWDTKRPTTLRSVSLPPHKWSAKQSYNLQESPRLRVEEMRTSGELLTLVDNEGDTANPLTMEIQGQRIKNDRKGNLSLFHSHHWEYYKNTRSEPTRSVMAASEHMDPELESIRTRIEHLENNYIDDSIYDSFDRDQTLPSISVRTAPMRRRRGRYDRNPSAKVPAKMPYRLGVANSLDVLSQFGQPGKVERHLTMQLKNTIHQLRRTKDNVSSLAGPRVLYRADNSSTPGETLLRVNGESSQDNTPAMTPRKMTRSDEVRTILENKNKERDDSALSKKLPVMIPPALTDELMSVRENGSKEQLDRIDNPDAEPKSSDVKDGAENGSSSEDGNQLQADNDNAEPDPQAQDNGSDYESSHSGIH